MNAELWNQLRAKTAVPVLVIGSVDKESGKITVTRNYFTEDGDVDVEREEKMMIDPKDCDTQQSALDVMYARKTQAIKDMKEDLAKITDSAKEEGIAQHG